ncbi:type II toxin-antitoxin system PemK/MazF family toxin [Streptacidiphilus sp. ASG 303]|uniref:type II toxin-antitoxin system PemK/MazF family toxin n=1 Tax=Streptacidiphilus sp. ASG 303 TaxID=2896847 RepID=UPI001E286F2B|nr:type II toxin-antitoxin system PemK/MazF family toxin [Streptacidiphilus sp. ASG 303]MCD0482341.1 type II toxin-antitoxin system PemK/MazF family toxin [Streptacidiphilus sp. ASG 303]
MVGPRTPLRGEVWLAAVPVAGVHPVVVLTANRIARPLSAVTVVLVTGTEGPEETRVALDAGSGLVKYHESYADCTSIHTLDKPRLRRCMGRVQAAEMARIEDSVRMVLGLRA